MASPKDYPFEEKGIRDAVDPAELRVFGRAELAEGGERNIPAAARRFQKQSAAELTVHPSAEELPRWVLALVQRKVSTEEFVRVVAERTMRAPSKENQTLALVLANEIGRMRGGGEAIRRHLTPQLLNRLSGRKGGE